MDAQGRDGRRGDDARAGASGAGCSAPRTRRSPWPEYWKPLYGIRNFVWIKRHLGRPGALTLPGLVGAYAVKALLFDDRPLRRLPWIVRFARAGWRGDFSGPTPQEWRAIARRG